jgi:hypothetical protein
VRASWRAWYDDGSRYDSDSTAWADLPDDGLQVVVIYFEDGTRRICHGDDWYFEVDGTIAHNSDSRRDNERRYPNAALKRGRWMADDAYKALVARALEA